MKQYVYYSKNDLTQEPYGKFEAIDLEEAILIASEIKQLSIQDFLSTFRVKEWKQNSKI